MTHLRLLNGQEDEIDPGQIEGTTLKILKYPHPQLRAEDKEITEFDESLKQVIMYGYGNNFCELSNI